MSFTSLGLIVEKKGVEITSRLTGTVITENRISGIVVSEKQISGTVKN